jgi:hypothetical protein
VVLLAITPVQEPPFALVEEMRTTPADVRRKLADSAGLVAVPEPGARVRADVQLTALDPAACTQARALYSCPSYTKPVFAMASRPATAGTDTFAEATVQWLVLLSDRSTHPVQA